MPQINDCIHTALGGVGHINDLLLAYYQSNGATAEQINDAEYEFLIAQGVAPAQLNDMWFEFLRGFGYTGALNDMLHQFWCEDSGVVSPTHILTNSAWDGVSGSVSGADFTQPTGWNNGFWPPHDAIAHPDTPYSQIQFLSDDAIDPSGLRGFTQYSIDGNAHLGEIINVSLYIDVVATHPSGRVLTVVGDVDELQREGPIVVGRVHGTYEITGPNVTLRCGIGTGGNAQPGGDITLSRPQVTIGERLWPWEAI